MLDFCSVDSRMSEKETLVGSSGTDELSQRIAGFLEISDDELKPVLADHVLSDCLVNKLQEFNNLQSNNLRLHATVDELKALCTSKVDSLKKETERLIRENDTEKQRRNRLEEQVSQLTKEKTLALGQMENVKFELQNTIEQKNVLKSNKQEVVKLLEEKISELEASKVESQELVNDNKNLRQQLMETQNEVQTLKCNGLGDKSELEIVKQQVGMLTKSNEWLEKEVTSKTEQLIKYRQENDTELQKSLHEVARLKNDYQLEKSSREFLLKKNQEISQDLQNKLYEIKKLSDELNTEKQEFSREMSLKQKLLDLQDEQLQSFKEELRLTEEKHNSTEADNLQSTQQARFMDDLAQVRQQLEESNHERLRLQAVVNEVMGDSEEFDLDSTANVSIPKLYGDIGVLKKQLIKERHQKENLQRQIESFVVELEYKVPVINSLKERSYTLEKELSDIALLLEHTSHEKERKARELESATGKIKQLEINTHTLIRQRSDLARQVQFLLFNGTLQNDSRGPLTADEVAFIKKIIENENPSNESDSQSIITERLVEFKDIATLQERNTELLKTARTLADRLEEEEKNSNIRIDSLERKTIDEAKEAIITLQERNSEIESKVSTIEKERDAYKAILSQTSQSFDNLGDADRMKDSQENQELIKSLEDKLSTLTTETSKNNELLNQEIRNLYQSKTQLTISREKERSSRTLAEDRLKLLQSTLEMTKNENAELIRRSHELQSILSKQEARNGETVNKYISCQSKLSVLEARAANLDAEKSLLQSSSDSLRREIQKISVERNSLNLMVTQLQTLQSERENLLKESQASHKAAIAQLEVQTSELKTEISSKDSEIKASEDAKSAQTKWFQEKIDEMSSDAGKIRDELATKTATVAQLELEVNDLKKKIEESDSRIASYKTLNDAGNGETTQGQLRKDLEKTMIELKHAYSQNEEFKQMSSTAEETLKNLSNEFEERTEALKSNAEKYLAEKVQLEQCVSNLKKNIDFLNNEYALQKNRSEEEKNEILKKLVSLESSEHSLGQVKKEYDQKLYQLQKDLEQQTAYANIAQKNYEEELQKHAEVSKIISQLRSEVQSGRSEIQQLKASEQQAKEVLENGEKSWYNQKTELDAHIDDLKRQVDNISSQNKLLFSQVELLSKSEREFENKLLPGSSELLISLRRERDILETKLTVSKREEKLLHQKQVALEDELAEARKKLFKLQENDSNHSDIAKQHEDIMEQLNQMNLLRESNVTLRNAVNAAQEKNSDLQSELNDLQSKILPLNSELSECRQSLEEKDQRIKLLIDEADRWKERSHDILRRHEKIDPEEYRKLEEEISNLKKELEAKSKENTDLNDRFTRLKKQAHEKLNASKIAQANLSAEVNELQGTKTKMEEILKETQTKVLNLEKLLTERDSESANNEDLRHELDDALERCKEIEVKLGETVGSSEGLTSQLNEEINSLKEQVRIFKEKENDSTLEGSQGLSNVVESMKKAFEEEKIKFIQEKTEEYNKKFEEEKAKLSSENGSPAEPVSAPDVNSLKKQWEEEYEAISQQRIQEAEENLKKRIRMPTEERIKKVLDKRKTELEEEFQRRLKENNLQPEGGDAKEREELKKQLESEFEAKYKEILASTKKKAFEEGKQQAAMKSTLLERKISKLESQLNSSNNPTPENAAATSVGLPTKIDESRTENMATGTPAFGEKVLKLSDKPAFSFQPSSKSNPFTSALPGNNNVFGMKPTFSFTPGSSQPESRPTFGSTGFNTTAEPESNRSSSQSEESIPEKQESASVQGQNGKVAEEAGSNVTTTQKRPADDQPDDEETHKREKQQSSSPLG